MAGRSATKQAERRSRILEEISSFPGILIRDLARKLAVSRETIRKDFDVLCAEGKLQRRYGGGAIVSTEYLPSFDARQGKHVPERTAIARKASELLRDHQVIMLSPGTSALLFASELAKTNKHLTFITNGIREAMSLACNENLQVVLAPGDIDRFHGYSWNHETARFISRYNADLAVIFGDGISENGVTDADSRTTLMVRAMLKQSKNNMLLIDHSRFSHHGMHQVCSLSELDVVISDKKPDQEFEGYFSQNKIDFCLAE